MYNNVDWTLGENKPKQSQYYLAPRFIWGLEPNMKKQSQFDGGQIVANSYLKGNYDNIVVCGTRKNKPNVNMGNLVLS